MGSNLYLLILVVVFTFFTGQAKFVAVSVCVEQRGLFIVLLPAINKPRSGRTECAGMGSRRKQKATLVKVHFRSIRSIGMESSGAFSLFLLMSEVVKKKKKPLQIRTVAGCVLPQLYPSPVCPVISVAACV